MKPHELANAIIAKANFNQNDCYELSMLWNDGKLQYCHLHKIIFKKSHFFNCENLSDIEKYKGKFHVPHQQSWSIGCLGVSLYVYPQRNIDTFNSKVVSGIYDCIKMYEYQLEKELDNTKKSLKLIKEQY